MKNVQKFAKGTIVWHFDLLAGWDQVRVLEFRPDNNMYLLSVDDPQYPFFFEDDAVFVHATPDNTLLPEFQFSPKA